MISPHGERMENLKTFLCLKRGYLTMIWLHVSGQFCAEVLKSLLNAFTHTKNAPVEL